MFTHARTHTHTHTHTQLQLDGITVLGYIYARKIYAGRPPTNASQCDNIIMFHTAEIIVKCAKVLTYVDNIHTS